MHQGERLHAATAVKELITIVMCLAAANVVTEFARNTQKTPAGYGLLAAMLLSVVRFYHGNVLSVDRHAAEGVPLPVTQAVTFFVVMAQSFLFSFVPYYFDRPVVLFRLIGAVFLLDIVWNVPHMIRTPWKINRDRPETVWAGLAVFGGLVIGFSKLFNLERVPTIVGILIVAGVLDYVVNSKLYFPSEAPAAASAQIAQGEKG